MQYGLQVMIIDKATILTAEAMAVNAMCLTYLMLCYITLNV